MDPSEFRRIAQRSDHEAFQRCPARGGETVNVRVGTFVARPRIPAPPRLAFVAGHGERNDLEQRLRIPQQRVQESIPERTPIVMQAVNLPPTRSSDVWNGLHRAPQGESGNRHQRPHISFASSLRGEEQQSRDLFGTRRERDGAPNGFAERRMQPLACYTPPRPPSSTTFAGLITPSIVGRPVMQFRGKSSAMQSHPREPIACRGHPSPQIVNLVDDDDASSESGLRVARPPKKTTYMRDIIQKQANRNGWKSVEASRAIRWKTSQLPSVCFSSNGMMQMDMRMMDDLRALPVQAESGTYEDGISAADLDSLGIAQQIGQSGPGLFSQRGNPPPSKRRPGPCHYDAVNLVSDEDEQASEPQSQPQMTSTVNESLQTKTSEVGQSPTEPQDASSRCRVMDCLQPILDAIEILQMQREPEESGCSYVEIDMDQSGQEDVTLADTSDEGSKSMTAPRRRARPTVRSLNDMSQEMIKKTEKHKRSDMKLRHSEQAPSTIEEEEEEDSSSEDERTSEETGPYCRHTVKRTKLTQKERDNSDPYRKIYTHKRRGRRIQEGRRFANGATDEDSAEIKALWKFLNEGIVSSQALADAAPHPLPATEEEYQDDILSHNMAVLHNHKASFSHKSAAPTDSQAWSKIKAWIESKSAGQLQHAVCQLSLRGLVQALLNGHPPTHSI